MKALAVGLTALALTASPGGQQPAYRTDVSLVRLDVLAIADGRPLYGLGASDFEVRDNGILQRIDAVVGENVPLDLVLLLDRSESVKGRPLAQLKEAALETIAALRQEDRVAVLSFADSLSLDASLESRREQVDRAIDALQAGGATAMMDALFAALSLPESPVRRRLILLFSDGYDNRSWVVSGQVVQAARESDAVICAVACPPSSRTIGPDRPLLDRVANATGGEVTEVDGAGELKSTFLSLLGRMRSRYLLTYYPAGHDRAEGWHEVKVRLRARKGRVVTRSGYFVPARLQ